MSGWDQTDTDRVMELWKLGVPASQIERDIMYRHSRNAIIAKMNRLKIPSPKGKGGDTPPRPKARNTRPTRLPQSRVSKRRKPMSSTTPPVVPDAPEPSQRLRLDELEPHHCRWPDEDVNTDYTFCGQPKEMGHENYCAFHADRARSPYHKSQRSEVR